MPAARAQLDLAAHGAAIGVIAEGADRPRDAELEPGEVATLGHTDMVPFHEYIGDADFHLVGGPERRGRRWNRTSRTEHPVNRRYRTWGTLLWIDTALQSTDGYFTWRATRAPAAES